VLVGKEGVGGQQTEAMHTLRTCQTQGQASGVVLVHARGVSVSQGLDMRAAGHHPLALRRSSTSCLPFHNTNAKKLFIRYRQQKMKHATVILQNNAM
jgi:hypothetical protein